MNPYTDKRAANQTMTTNDRINVMRPIIKLDVIK